MMFLAPFAKGKKGEFKDDFNLFLRKGYMRARGMGPGGSQCGDQSR